MVLPKADSILFVYDNYHFSSDCWNECAHVFLSLIPISSEHFDRNVFSYFYRKNLSKNTSKRAYKRNEMNNGKTLFKLHFFFFWSNIIYFHFCLLYWAIFSSFFPAWRQFHDIFIWRNLWLLILDFLHQNFPWTNHMKLRKRGIMKMNTLICDGEIIMIFHHFHIQYFPKSVVYSIAHGI